MTRRQSEVQRSTTRLSTSGPIAPSTADTLVVTIKFHVIQAAVGRYAPAPSNIWHTCLEAGCSVSGSLKPVHRCSATPSWIPAPEDLEGLCVQTDIQPTLQPVRFVVERRMNFFCCSSAFAVILIRNHWLSLVIINCTNCSPIFLVESYLLRLIYV